MQKIDAHNHPDWYDHDFERFVANMDRYGISRTWLLSWECGADEYEPCYRKVTPGPLRGLSEGPIPFSCCIPYRQRAPERFVLGYCPDPRRPDAVDRLYEAHELHGAKICGELKVRMEYDRPEALALFKAAGRLGMPVVFHLQYDLRRSETDPWCEWWGGSLAAVERMLAACPETIFLGHAPGFWIHISNDDLWQKVTYPDPHAAVVPGGLLPQLLRRYPNLYCDMSAGSGCRALSRDPAFTVDFLTEFRKRVVYARDYFDNIHQELLDSLGLPEEIQADLYYRNAERLLR